jgi:hypothetical protein
VGRRNSSREMQDPESHYSQLQIRSNPAEQDRMFYLSFFLLCSDKVRKEMLATHGL